MRPVAPSDVVNPWPVVTGPVAPPLPGHGTTQSLAVNPALGFLPAVSASLGAPQGFASSGALAPDYAGLAGLGLGSGSRSSGSGGCGCG